MSISLYSPTIIKLSSAIFGVLPRGEGALVEVRNVAQEVAETTAYLALHYSNYRNLIVMN